MLPIRTIRDVRVDTRPQRAANAVALLHRMEAALDIHPSIRWKAWEALHAGMVENLTPETLPGFQGDPSIAPQICGGGGDSYLTRLREVLGEQALSFFLSTFRETLCGNPQDLTSVAGCPITRTSMRHVYHLAVLHRFCRDYYGRPIDFIEIGGGFGNLARLCAQYSVARRYYIVDFPATSAVQYFFLSEFFDESEIAVWTGTEYLTGGPEARFQLVLPNAVQGLCSRIGREQPRALVSTMALTEIPLAGQEFYMEHLTADMAYVFGQTSTTALPNAIPTDHCGVLANHPLFHGLAQTFHPVEFRRGDYYSEFLGIRS